MYSFLFTGDTEEINELDMLSSSVNLKTNVLKVSHHDSNPSTSKSFLKAVTLEYVVISVGNDNKPDTFINSL